MSTASPPELRACLHLGSEKTGSSFLQHLCVKYRELLGHCGIAFPPGTPHDERCMRNGQISAGNGRQLAAAVHDDDWKAINQLIVQAVTLARRNNARTLLISSEHLLAALNGDSRLARLIDGLDAAGVSSVSLLLVLRDPVEQLLSLYKHRAKGGIAGRIDEWVSNGYHLPRELQALRRHAVESRADLTVRAYSRQPGGLEEIFFADWLGLDKLPDAAWITVNPSLTLSELELIRQMAERKPALVPFLYRHLAAIPGQIKMQGNALEAYAQAVAANTVWQHREEWRRWNERLPEGEALEIPAQAPDLPEWPQELGFSSAQLDGLADFMAESTRLRFWLRLVWKSRLRPGLARLRNWTG